jgi:hypothetical protein
MPTVPQGEGKGLLAEDPSGKPDASSILKAVSLMHSMGRLGPGGGRGAGGIEKVGPRKSKMSKGPKSVIR